MSARLSSSALREIDPETAPGDLALTLCSPEPPVLTQLRDWLVSDLPMEEAVRGLPEEQGRILGTLVRAMDARRILDLGTFTGYSSIAMALAAAEDARVVCCEPQAQYGRSPSKRGVGLSFGPDVTRAFLERNGLDLVVRSHEVRDNGYEVEHGGSLITVFSAPNYCDAMGNKGAFIHLSAALEPKFTTYDAVPHPPLRPMAYASASPFGL